MIFPVDAATVDVVEVLALVVDLKLMEFQRDGDHDRQYLLVIFPVDVVTADVVEVLAVVVDLMLTEFQRDRPLMLMKVFLKLTKFSAAYRCLCRWLEA